jgi:putative tricarboxylic transport membrane protein
VELLSNLAIGFEASLAPVNLFYCFVGVLLGTLIGVLPGIGPTATIAMLLPITFGLKPETSLIMLAGIYYGAQYGGSTTAILINLPGESSSAVTAIDGYQMAKQGRAGPALATAALGSFFAGSVSLIFLGLISSVALAHGSVIKALAMIVLGLLFGLVGTDVTSGAQRFTLGIPEISDKLEFVAVAIGVFGLAEILRNLENEHDRDVMVTKITGLLPSKEDFRAMVGPVLRGTALGSALGILPGGGAILSSFAAYTVEKKISKHPERFGKGAIEGVAAPESANNAGAQTSFIPMLTLGIPANAVMALMVGAMIIQGIQPGPNVAIEQPSLFWGVITSMWIGNLMLVLLNLPLIGLWVRLLTIPYTILFPAILVFCSIGVFSVNSNVFDLYTVAFFGFIGYVLVKLGCEPAPLLLGFVLGPMIEENLRRAMTISRGDWTVFFTRPLSATLLVISVLVLAVVFLPSVRKKREEVFVEED